MSRRRFPAYLLSAVLASLTACSGGARPSTAPTTKAPPVTSVATTTIPATTTTTTEPQLVASLLSTVNYPELIPVAQDRLKTKEVHYVVTTATSTTEVINVSGSTFNPDAEKTEISFLESLPTDPRFNKVSINLTHDGTLYPVQLDPAKIARRVAIIVAPNDPTPSWVGTQSPEHPIGGAWPVNGNTVIFIRSGTTDPFNLFGVAGASGLDKGLNIDLCETILNVTPLDDNGRTVANILPYIFCNPLAYALAVKQYIDAVRQPISQLQMYYATFPVSMMNNKTYYAPPFNQDLYNAAPSSPAFS